MSISLARSLLPKGSIIGVSCNTEDHVRAGVEDRVDYVGIGAVWGTQTKQLNSPVIGVRRVGKMLEILDGTEVKAVAIGASFEIDAPCLLREPITLFVHFPGGIKSTNLLRTLHGCVSATNHALDGVAVVSDIVASREPRFAAEKLFKILEAFKATNIGLNTISGNVSSKEDILEGVIELMNTVRKSNPLVHQVRRFPSNSRSIKARS